MPKGFSESEKEIIASRLLEQGQILFSSYGLKKTSVEEIAKAAGISKGAFYGFYESKESLFMDVIEQIEIRFRQEMFALIDLPGPSPRSRLFAVLKKAFSMVETTPILQFLSGGDYDMLFRRVPASVLEEHLASDRVFLDELITRCQNAGIPIQVGVDQITGLLYPIVLAYLQGSNPGPIRFGGNLDLLLELVAAFCLGEIELQLQPPAGG